jgi:hypothetical protein
MLLLKEVPSMRSTPRNFLIDLEGTFRYVNILPRKEDGSYT